MIYHAKFQLVESINKIWAQLYKDDLEYQKMQVQVKEAKKKLEAEKLNFKNGLSSLSVVTDAELKFRALKLNMTKMNYANIVNRAALDLICGVKPKWLFDEG